MANPTFTNNHIHIFNDKCVSRNFLKVIPSKGLRFFAPQVLNLLKGSGGRLIVKMMAKAGRKKSGKKRTMADKMISFLNIALQATQEEVLKTEMDTALSYDPSARVVALTMNMDYMDDELPPMSFETQLIDVMNIKFRNAQSFFPFLGIDPRHKSGTQAEEWAKKFFERGVQRKGSYFPYFVGLKLYPALGFFPFDWRLNELYRYAEANALPVMSHCTRVGSQYIGKNIEGLIPRVFSAEELSQYTAATPEGSQNIADAFKNIQARITAFYSRDGWIKNNKRGANDKACDLFSHPENYVPLLNRYPNLKICLAHMGGASEIWAEKYDDDVLDMREVDRSISKDEPLLWSERIREMMIRYPNLYVDISYTLSSLEEENVLKKILEFFDTPDNTGALLSERVLFGTDFFMTEQEMREAELFALAKEKLAKYWHKLTRENPRKYMGL